MHALEVVGKAKGGRGNKGGLTAYATQMAISQPYLTHLVQAATVAKAWKAITQAMGFSVLLDKAKHLHALHALPSSFWPAMVNWLVAGKKGEPICR